MITTIEEFIKLRTSEVPSDYQRAIHEPAPESLWFELLASHPEMTFWVIQNKTVPLSILAQLAHHPAPGIRRDVARKRKLSDALFEQLANDIDEYVRLTIVMNQKLPYHMLQKLAQDPSPLVSEKASARLKELSSS